MSAAIAERSALASFEYPPESRAANATNRRNGEPIAIVSPKLARLIGTGVCRSTDAKSPATKSRGDDPRKAEFVAHGCQ